jgi:carboxyl-terminal processing protease
MRNFLIGCAASLFVVLLTLMAMGAGFATHAYSSGALGTTPEIATAETAPSIAERPANFHVMQEALDLLRTQFFGELPQGEQVEYAAIRGVLRRLQDPNTILVEPEAHRREQEQFQGEFGGIGAQVTMDEDGNLVIVAPIADTPAARADLRPNDIILEVDGTLVRGMNINEAIALIRGPVGTEVTLLVQRGGAEAFQVTLERATIPDPTVDHSLIEGTNIGYIRMVFFSARTTDELREAIVDLQAQGAEKYVLDLRNNPGGLLDTAIGTASLFLHEEVIAYQQFNDGSRQPHGARGAPALPGEPLVVLINEGSASASEILAGALQAYNRATLVGTRSYGKGTVQIPYRLSDGSSLHVTVAHWLTPHEVDLSAEGLTPDEQVELTEADIEAGVDPVLERATQLLEEMN